MYKSYLKVIVFLECYLLVYSAKRSSTNCIISIANKGVNLSILNDINGYEVFSENNTYILNICGPTSRCKNPDASACMINEKNEIEDIGSINNFKFDKTKLKYKINNHVKTIIEFKCNRHVEAFLEHNLHTTPKEIKKFTFYTSLVCKKMPLECKTYDVENDDEYDITSLYKYETNWVVRNVSSDIKIFLNLCGNLHSISTAGNRDCQYGGTQICLVDQYGKTTNLGVFSSDLQFTENGLSVQFTGGSLCGNITSIVTKIDFICSFNNSGPILIHFSNCEYHIIWYTPTACPHHISVDHDCNKRLNVSREKEISIAPKLKIKYNICGVLKDTCKKKSGVSVCLIKDKQEIILGKSNNTVISKDAAVYLNLTGELCDIENVPRSVNIEFHCDYTKDKPEEVLVNKTNLCTATIKVYTTKVCDNFELPDESENCALPVNNSYSTYDLSPLTLKNKNYEIRDPNRTNLVYLLNVCQPLVHNANSLCQMGSSVCLRNDFEPNNHKRFKSLASYTKSSSFRMQDGKIILEYSGEVCQSDKIMSAEYRVIIEFHCGYDPDEFGIKLVDKSECKYKFAWKTQYACLRKASNESSFESKTINATINQVHNIMEEHTQRDDIFTTHSTKIAQASSENALGYTHSTTITILHDDQSDKDETNIVNKTIFTKGEKITDSSLVEDVKSAIDNTPSEHFVIHIPFELYNSRGIFIKNCALKDQFHEYDMYYLPKITKVLSKDKKEYSINICSQHSLLTCKTMKCIDHLSNITIVKQSIVLNFTGNINCNKRSFYTMLILKCSDKLGQPHIIQEEECSVYIKWENEAACTFLKNSKIESHFTTAKIIGVTVGAATLITVICAVGYYFVVRKRSRIESPFHLERCEYSRIKDSAKIA